MRGGDERSRRRRDRGGRRQHLVDQGGLEGSFDAAANQVAQGDLEYVLTGRLAYSDDTYRCNQS